MKEFLTTFSLVLILGLNSCGASMAKPTRAEMLKKTASLKRKGELRSALGEPNETIPLPGDERIWIYHSADGDVTYHIFGDFFEEKK